MNKEDLIKLKEELANLSEEEKKERDWYLRQLQVGTIAGPLLGYPSIDKPWLKHYSERQIKKEIPNMSVFNYLYHNNIKSADNIALNYYGKKIDYTMLLINIERTAKALKAMGVKEQEIVSIIMPNTPEAIYLFYAISKIGAIAQFISPKMDNKTVQKEIASVNANKVIVIDSCYNNIKELSERGIVEDIIVVPFAKSLPLGLNISNKAKHFFETLMDKNKKNVFNDKTITWEEFLETGNYYNEKTEVPYVANRPFVITYTDGTSDVPKRVLLSNENINENAIQNSYLFPQIRREDKWLDVLPISMAYGMSMNIHMPLIKGMELDLVSCFESQDYSQLIIKNAPLYVTGTPLYLSDAVNNAELNNANTSYMNSHIIVNDVLDPTLERRANDYFQKYHLLKPIYKGYGLTETAGGVTQNIASNNLVGSVGIPFVKNTVGIFEPNTSNELSYGEIGEICISGPSIMLEYYNNKKETAKVLKKHEDGLTWLHTKDLGRMDSDGNLYIIERMDRVITKKDGSKVYPTLIERIINKNHDVLMSKVVEIPDPDNPNNSILKAYIILKDESDNEPKDIVFLTNLFSWDSRLTIEKPIIFEFCNDFPLTPNDRIDCSSLKKGNNSTYQRIRSKK